MTGNTKEHAPNIFPILKRCLIALAANACMLTAAQTNLLWSEEFSSGSAPDPNTWTAETGDGSQYGIPGWGNNELQNYTGDAANVRVESGSLIITALRNGNNFTSARIKTQNKITFQYGTVEARIKTPDLANGLWPAFWTLGNLWTQGESWPTCGEIDIMEMGSSSGIANGTVNRRIGSATHSASAGSASGYLTVTSDIDDTFVIYRMEWTPSSITMYIDNQQIWSKNISSIPEFHKPHFLLLNLAVGGNYTGITNPNQITAPFPAEYVVDYIRIYDNGYTVMGGNWPAFTVDPIIKPNATESSAYSDTIAGSATDADAGDILTYSKVSGPNWLSVATNGTLSGTPGDADTGLNSWTVQVSDGNGGTDTATLRITVDNINNDPVFTIDPIIMPNGVEDSGYNGTVAGSATDADAGDNLTYSRVSGPTWMYIASSGDLLGTPRNANVGLNSWTVRVSDGNGGVDTATLEITVEPLLGPPMLSIQPSGSNLEILWPAPSSGYSLYGTTNLLAPVVWSAVTNTPILQGEDWMVVLPIAGAPQFFRLENP